MAEVVEAKLEPITVEATFLQFSVQEALRAGDRVVVDRETYRLRKMRDGDREWFVTALLDAEPGQRIRFLRDGSQTLWAPF